MIQVGKDVARIAQQPSTERVKALKRIVPWATIRKILKETGHDRRLCPRLPGWFMVWFIIALGLFCCDCYRQVFRWLQPFRKKGTPGRSTLCEARKRIGVAPLRLLYEKVVTLLAEEATPECFYRDMRLMAIDGFVVDLADTKELERIFGRPQSGRTAGAFPQARVVALCEVGTHVIWRHLVKPIRRGEIPMASHLLRYLEANMLLMWDRNFLSYANVEKVLERKAHVLARIKKNMVFRPIRRFRDGSYLAKLYRRSSDRDADRNGILVRIIEYTFNDPGRPGSGERHRLLTTLLDAKLDPAKKLILLYHERWEEEIAIDEIKTHQRERPVLRSQTAAGVIQEIYGLLLGHYVVRKLMFEAAKQDAVAPRQLSFVNALKILRCRLPEAPRSPRGLKRWYEDLLAEIAEEKLDPRRDRINPRVVRRKMSKWEKKKPKHSQNPQPTKKIERSIKLLR